MLYKIILLTIGTLSLITGIALVRIHPPIAIIFALPAAYCLLRVIIWPITDKIAGGIFSPARRNRKPAFMFDKIGSMITKQDYAQALAELEAVLEQDKLNYTATSMVAGLYAKKFNEPQKSLACIKNYLDKKDTRSSDDTDMVLMFSDICSENNMTALAIETIENELLKKYNAAEKRTLTLRLDALKSTETSAVKTVANTFNL